MELYAMHPTIQATPGANPKDHGAELCVGSPYALSAQLSMVEHRSCSSLSHAIWSLRYIASLVQEVIMSRLLYPRHASDSIHRLALTLTHKAGSNRLSMRS